MSENGDLQAVVQRQNYAIEALKQRVIELEMELINARCQTMAAQLRDADVTPEPVEG